SCEELRLDPCIFVCELVLIRREEMVDMFVALQLVRTKFSGNLRAMEDSCESVKATFVQ
ncbi:hypothetical protein KI387_027906, partial [Taxus chinensis]